MIPVAIPSPGGDCFAAYHPAAGPAVLICPMFGYEALSTYRVWRRFAENLAGQGTAVLRLDLPGTGDSAGGAEMGDKVGAWRGAVDAAMGWLRERHKAVSLVGCRFGALMALDAVGRGVACEALVLMDPPADGKAMVRQLRARARMKSAGGGEGDGAMQAYGMTLDDAMLGALGALPARAAGLDMDVLVIGDAPAWLDGAAARVEATAFEEREAFVMRDSFQLRSPDVAFGRVLAFFAARHRVVKVAEVVASGVVGMGWREEPVWFGPGLFGVMCLPDRASGVAVVIPSVGNLPRSGPGRTSADMARRFAGAGHVSLRYDCACVGESEGEPEGDNSVETYLPHQVSELSLAVDVLEAHGFRRVVVAGHCSGAYLGWHAAGVDERIVGVFAANLVIFWYLDETTAPRVVRPEGTPNPDLPKVAAGPVGLKDRVRGLVQRVMPELVWDALRGMTPEERAVRRHLRRVVGRGCRVELVYGDQEDERYRFHRAFGRRERLPAGARVVVVPGADHMFSAVRHRAALLDLAVRFVASEASGADRGAERG